ncbi:MAG: hypothetical protein L6R38_003052 [Xanthoria sp. 2 TBL-2021]|nr:MAG: hypothetical protein L6R38_003052 [Xanthoria sp. 2 TBL-2021]
MIGLRSAWDHMSSQFEYSISNLMQSHRRPFADSLSPNRATESMSTSTESKPRSRDWTCFLADRESTNGVRSTGGSRQPREWTSPVYSLSSPSLYSPTFFAGVEGHVIQVDVADAYDRFPDPIYKYGPESTGKRDRDATRKWDPESNIMCVNAYQHVHTNIEMMHQTRIGERKPGDQMPGLRRGEVPLPPGWDERCFRDLQNLRHPGAHSLRAATSQHLITDRIREASHRRSN